MRMSYPTLQEMKAYTCKHCLNSAKYKIHDNDSTGIDVVYYLCSSHYADLVHEQHKEHRECRCDWCGSTKDDQLIETERWGEITGRIYRVCTVCMVQQDELMANDFDDEDEDPNEGLY